MTLCPPREKCFSAHILGLSLNQQFFFRCGNFVKKLNFASTPWKIIIPLGNSVGNHIWVIQMIFFSIWVGNDFFFCTNFSDNFFPDVEISSKNILGLSLNQQFFSRCGNFIKKLNFASTPWKIIIPLGNSVGNHIWVIQIHLGG